MNLRSLLSFATIGSLALMMHAQPGSLDPSFGLGTGANNTIRRTILLDDGKLLVPGYYTSYNGIPRNRIMRLNADGSLDPAFDPGNGATGGGGALNAAVQVDGKIVLAGQFTSYDNTPCGYITRIHADGSLDTSFHTGAGTNWWINGVNLQSDGKIIIGGDFTEFDGIERRRTARLNTDGSLDTSFDPGTGADQNILSTNLQADGKILIAGWFEYCQGSERGGIARLDPDGSLDPTFDQGPGTDNYVMTTVIQPDGKILIGGGFTNYNGTPRNRIARLNADGSLDDTFDPGVGANAWISAVGLQPDGRVLIGGEFLEYNGSTCDRIARLNADGSHDATFDAGSGFNDLVHDIVVLPDGKLIVTGEFTGFNGFEKNRIVRLNGDDLETGIQTYEEAGVPLRVFPNPSTGILTVVPAEDGMTWFRLRDPIGRLVLEEQHMVLAGREVRLSLIDHPTGSYQLEVRSTSGIRSASVVKY